MRQTHPTAAADSHPALQRCCGRTPTIARPECGASASRSFARGVPDDPPAWGAGAADAAVRVRAGVFDWLPIIEPTAAGRCNTCPLPVTGYERRTGRDNGTITPWIAGLDTASVAFREFPVETDGMWPRRPAETQEAVVRLGGWEKIDHTARTCGCRHPAVLPWRAGAFFMRRPQQSAEFRDGGSSAPVPGTTKAGAHCVPEREERR